jgi:hypothetical protein
MPTAMHSPATAAAAEPKPSSRRRVFDGLVFLGRNPIVKLHLSRD